MDNATSPTLADYMALQVGVFAYVRRGAHARRNPVNCELVSVVIPPWVKDDGKWAVTVRTWKPRKPERPKGTEWTLAPSRLVPTDLRLCLSCAVPHFENCRMCMGFGLYGPGEEAKTGYIVSASEAIDGPVPERARACPMCGSTIEGVGLMGRSPLHTIVDEFDPEFEPGYADEDKE